MKKFEIIQNGQKSYVLADSIQNEAVGILILKKNIDRPDCWEDELVGFLPHSASIVSCEVQCAESVSILPPKCPENGVASVKLIGECIFPCGSDYCEENGCENTKFTDAKAPMPSQSKDILF